MKIDGEALRGQFQERLADLVRAGQLGDSVMSLVLGVLDSSLQGPELQRDALVENIASRQDVSFVLYGAFSKSSRRDLYVKMGHGVASVIGNKGPLASSGDIWSVNSRADTSIHSENYWAKAQNRGIAQVPFGAAVIKSVTSEGHPMLSLIITDNSRDNRGNSHTDFHTVADAATIEQLWETSQALPDTMPKLFETIYPGQDIMPDFGAIQVSTHFQV